MSEHPALTPRTTAVLLVPPLLWAGNTIVGRVVHELMPPMTLNFLRWALALLLLWPLSRGVLRPGSALWTHWRRYALLGLLGVGSYNSLQYLALHTSTPLNATLVLSSSPAFMLALGALCFGQRVRARQIAGAALSILGVLLVLGRGDWQTLTQVHLVPGDLWMLIATATWAWYSWLLTRLDLDPPEVRGHWASFLVAQIAFGLMWSAAFSVAEWSLTEVHIVWGWPLALALLYVALGPSVLAYGFWAMGVRWVGPATAGFFVNLMPLFAALLSVLALGEAPHGYHLAAFVLIVGGIVVSARR